MKSVASLRVSITSKSANRFILNTLLCNDRTRHLSETWKQVNFIKRINVYLSIRGLIENISVIKQEVILIQPNLPMASGRGQGVPSYRGNCFDTSTFFSRRQSVKFWTGAILQTKCSKFEYMGNRIKLTMEVYEADYLSMSDNISMYILYEQPLIRCEKSLFTFQAGVYLSAIQ